MKIRTAGNTGAPCYFVIKSKGYEVEMITYKLDDDWNCEYDYNTTKEEWNTFTKIRDDSPLYDNEGNIIIEK